MLICPHCGAENPDRSAFCSLCLAKFSVHAEGPGVKGDYDMMGPSKPPSDLGVQEKSLPESEYVSPGDFHSLQDEAKRSAPASSYGNSPYLGAVATHPGAVPVTPPVWMMRRTMLQKVLLVLKHSLVMFFVLLAASFLLSLVIVGAAFGGSITSWGIAMAIQVLAEALILIWAGYRTSAEAMEANAGWIYGMACVGAIAFIWQPLFVLIISFFISGRVLMPIFDIIGLMVVLFLFLPMGALGGWLAEKRYVG